MSFALQGTLFGEANAKSQASYVGNVEKGKAFFQRNCSLCHTIVAAGIGNNAGPGPALDSVMYRRAGTLPGFGYTKALRGSNLTWDYPTLNQFLADPGKLVPGTAMVVSVPSQTERIDLISFLETFYWLPKAKVTPVPVHPHERTAGDWQNDAPGVRHRIHLESLPAPYATVSVGNDPVIVDRPPLALPVVPAGFKAELFASGLQGPRLLRTAPNGDVFLAETGVGRIRVFRTTDGADAPSQNVVFADHLGGPFGVAFYPVKGEPRWVYVALLNSIVRFPYRSGDMRARGPAETVVPQLSVETGGHTTRDVAFSPDGSRMFISIGSASNIADWMEPKTIAQSLDWQSVHPLGEAWGNETNRAAILETDPEGHEPIQVFATGIRNGATIAVHPVSGDLWVATNERDFLGDDLVPDYLTRVRKGGFYGWPWYYMGNHEDPRHAGERPDLAGKAIVPDVPVQPHSAPLQFAFYPMDATGVAAFPAEYRGDIFAAFHGSFNRTGRTGSKIVRLLLHDGVPTGEYEDFVTGFVLDDSEVWCRPVGITVAHDGALLVTDDGNGNIWRISHIPSAH